MNPYAYAIFERDVTRVCQYFERYNIKSDPVRMAAALWAKHENRLTSSCSVQQAVDAWGQEMMRRLAGAGPGPTSERL